MSDSIVDGESEYSRALLRFRSQHCERPGPKQSPVLKFSDTISTGALI